MATPVMTHAEAIKAAADTAAVAVKAANELKLRVDRLTPDPAVLKSAAEALVDTRWVDGTVDVEKVAAALADPTMALRLLREVALKSADKLAQVNPRLDAGEVLGSAPKRAAEQAPPEDVANKRWHEKMAGYRRTNGFGA